MTLNYLWLTRAAADLVTESDGDFHFSNQSVEKGLKSYIPNVLNAPDVNSRLEIKLFFQGAQLHLQKLPNSILYRKQYICGLPVEIWGSRRRIQGTLGSWHPLISSPGIG